MYVCICIYVCMCVCVCVCVCVRARARAITAVYGQLVSEQVLLCAGLRVRVRVRDRHIVYLF